MNGVAFSPDGKLVASADSDGTVQLWNPVTGQPVGAPLLARSSVIGVAISPDGKLVASAGADGTVRVWSTLTSQPASPSTGGWFVVLGIGDRACLVGIGVGHNCTGDPAGQDHPRIEKSRCKPWPERGDSQSNGRRWLHPPSANPIVNSTKDPAIGAEAYALQYGVQHRELLAA